MNGVAHWQSRFPKDKKKRTHQCTKLMNKGMKKATSRIIGQKKRKKNMIMRIGVALIIVIQSAPLVRRTSQPKSEHNNKDGIPRARKGKLARNIMQIP